MKTRIVNISFGNFVVAFLLMEQFAFAGPITFSSALPVSTDEFIFRGQTKFVRSTDDPGPQDRELEVVTFPTVGVYGVTERWAVFAIVPILDKRLEVNTPEGRRERGDSGIGDLRSLVRYTIWKKDKPGSTIRLAPFLGLEVPTGEDDETDSLGRLPQPLQLGSGSWDPFLGAALTWQTLDWELDGALSYKFNTEANDFEFGDEFSANISFQYRFWPRELGGGVPGFLYGVLESNLIWTDRNEFFGREDPDSGGTTWFLVPGIQFVTARYVLETAIQLPVAQELNGNALENDFIITAGFRVNF